MKRWLLYHTLTILDVLRLWPTVQHHIVIVAGICLPILLLLGLKNGHVAELREELLKSPTGRQIVFWSGQHGELMTLDAVRAYEKEIPGVEIVIPEMQRLVSLSALDDEGETRHLESVTLYSTRSGDPILRQYGVEISSEEGTGIVLMRHVAESLRVGRGDKVLVTVERARDGMAESASVDLTLLAVIESNDSEKNAVGYVDVETLAAMEQYVMGFQVRKFGWPAFRVSAPDAYSSYLMFCENSSPLTAEDVRTFTERGYMITEIDGEEVRSLYGLLTPDSLNELLVYQLSIQSNQRRQSLNMAPGQISRLTEADDVVIPWNEPIEGTISDRSCRLVGLSIPQRTWLRLYLKHRDCGFDFDADTFSIQFLDEKNASEIVEFTSSRNTVIALAAKNLPVTRSPLPTEATVSDEPKQSKSSEPGSPQSAEAGFPQGSQRENSSQVKGATDEKRDAAPSDASDDQAGQESVEKEPQPESASAIPDSSSGRDVEKTVEQTETNHGKQPLAEEQNDPSLPATMLAGDSASDGDRSQANAGPVVAVVPMDLLAHLRAEDAGRVEYDSLNKLFVPLPSETLFDKARLYADTIDKVPAVVEQLRKSGFAIMSEVTRIREIHQQDHSLQLLVLIVGAGVFIFGTVTVVSVLLDSTERKRGTIGILRVMGVSRIGVFYMVFFRSAIIGILAAGVTIGLGMLAATFLEWQPPVHSEWANWKPVIHVIVRPVDVVVVVLGALACCTLGSIVPANRASRMDPFDAIVEGRFR